VGVWLDEGRVLDRMWIERMEMMEMRMGARKAEVQSGSGAVDVVDVVAARVC
jgi:hypothetical protein